MGSMSTSFTVACSSDRALLAVQDCLNQLGWAITELSDSLIQVQGPKNNAFHWYDLPKVAIKLNEVGGTTSIDISVSNKGPVIMDTKRNFVGILGTLTNAISLRVQTESLLINPTVAIGQGQPLDSRQLTPPAVRDIAQQLVDLKALLDAGVLTQVQFEKEKSKILGEGV